jgi:hypothetical protein
VSQLVGPPPAMAGRPGQGLPRPYQEGRSFPERPPPFLIKLLACADRLSVKAVSGRWVRKGRFQSAVPSSAYHLSHSIPGGPGCANVCDLPDTP